MILVDFNGVAVASMYTSENIQKGENNKPEINIIRHLLLNSLRSYNKKFQNKYGQMVICVDSSSWRKQYFSHYKANRKKSRDASDLDWQYIFDGFHKIVEEINENLPWVCIKVKDAEADDIIATLCNYKPENHMIVSNDKDFLQLKKFSNVAQFSPMKNTTLACKDPDMFLKEHILKGDTSDGIPNVLSDDDTFVDETKRQTPLTAKKKQAFLDNWEEECERNVNIQRNQKMIDLINGIPEDLQNKIMETYHENEKNVNDNSKVLNYLIKERLSNLIENVEDFFVSKSHEKSRLF